MQQSVHWHDNKNKLDIRVKQHINDCREHNGFEVNRNALSQHKFHLNHKFDFEKVSILDIEPNYKK